MARGLAMLESSKVKSLKEIAERENTDNSYVSRVVNLTCLWHADIVVAILEDELPNYITLFELAVDPSPLWEAQNANSPVLSNR